ncbi:UTP:RNA uridylyltransferase 1 [Aristolochia californica]|uniref:UTP:RNA uridylyltransferase 1 n=1 Tax=Aristolochia californica TaxID=171875 RepID=UPI0035D88C96
MSGGGGLPTPSDFGPSGGEFLLKLLQKPPQLAAEAPQPPSSLRSTPSSDHLNPNHHDPAVAAMGPSIPFPPWPTPEMRPFYVHYPQPSVPSNLLPPNNSWPISAGFDLHGAHLHSKPQFFTEDSNQRSGFASKFGSTNPGHSLQSRNGFVSDISPTFGSIHGELLSHKLVSSTNGGPSNSSGAGDRMAFESPLAARGSTKSSVVRPTVSGPDCIPPGLSRVGHQPKSTMNAHGIRPVNHVYRQRASDDVSGKQQTVPFRRTSDMEHRRQPGQSRKQKELGQWVGTAKGEGDRIERREHMPRQNNEFNLPLTVQLDRPGPPSGSNLHSASATDIQDSLVDLHGQGGDKLDEEANGLSEQFMDAVAIADEPVSEIRERTNSSSRGKDMRSGVSRIPQIPSQRMRNRKRDVECRRDIEQFATSFLSIYESLIPPEEEKAKQEHLLKSLERLVNNEWPEAQLFLYGSCANSFGVSKSDIDVCLAIDEQDVNKADILLKLAEILESNKFQNVQALTRARVPIVKLMDPVTGVSCDICINNILAVVNTKLLRNYAQIDARLRQLAFIVKHWAKSRGVNETYHGTLSSYAYVLMCIHFLQQRKPAILPCLQEMEATYMVTVDDIVCAYFDEVGRLCEFGAQNKESIARLLWEFFDYWAFRHDYANAVISVRTGSIISKRAKDWTRRIGNDRHLICIEDPFEISHDLGRVVDKYSIKILREEFERAAYILQCDPNPSVTLFEPYISS